MIIEFDEEQIGPDANYIPTEAEFEELMRDGELSDVK